MTPEVDAKNEVHNEIKIYVSEDRDPKEIIEKVRQREFTYRFTESVNN